jgi:hypothetical protein
VGLANTLLLKKSINGRWEWRASRVFSIFLILMSRTCRVLPKPCQILTVRFKDSGVSCASALLLLGISDNSGLSRFLSALVASLQAATYVQRVFRGQKACRTFRQPCQNHVESSAATAIFRHGLPKMMSKKV